MVAEFPADLYAKLVALVSYAIPGITEESIHGIMQLRVLQKKMESYELLQSDGVQDFLDEDSKKELKKFTLM